MEKPTKNEELYNIKWNSYSKSIHSHLLDHFLHESLVDVTLYCEGQYIKAHKLILSSCSPLFREMFLQNPSERPFIILNNDIKVRDLRLIISFMYNGEIKVPEKDLQNVLALGRMLKIKGLSNIKDKTDAASPTENIQYVNIKQETSEDTIQPVKKEDPEVGAKTYGKVSKKLKLSETIVKTKPVPKSSTESTFNNSENQIAEEDNDSKKRKNTDTLPENPKTKRTNAQTEVQTENSTSQELAKTEANTTKSSRNVNNAFMIFTETWRKKLTVEYPDESKKDISTRLGNMWKNLSKESKDCFYDMAKKVNDNLKFEIIPIDDK